MSEQIKPLSKMSNRFPAIPKTQHNRKELLAFLKDVEEGLEELSERFLAFTQTPAECPELCMLMDMIEELGQACTAARGARPWHSGIDRPELGERVLLAMTRHAHSNVLWPLPFTEVVNPQPSDADVKTVTKWVADFSKIYHSEWRKTAAQQIDEEWSIWKSADRPKAPTV